jgi:hypothetical protein
VATVPNLAVLIDHCLRLDRLWKAIYALAFLIVAAILALKIGLLMLHKVVH